jgi:hypothetical protein
MTPGLLYRSVGGNEHPFHLVSANYVDAIMVQASLIASLVVGGLCVYRPSLPCIPSCTTNCKVGRLASKSQALAAWPPPRNHNLQVAHPGATCVTRRKGCDAAAVLAASCE